MHQRKAGIIDQWTTGVGNQGHRLAGEHTLHQPGGDAVLIMFVQRHQRPVDAVMIQ